MIERSRTPVSANCKVRGIGVAVSVSTWTSARSDFSRSLCATPKCCSSSTTTRPRSLNLMALPSSAWVPTTMSIWPSAMPFLTRVKLGRRHQPRRLPDLHRKALEALGEGLGVLARQQRGRHHHRDLLAAHHGGERRAQRHLGLAEADVAADEPVHRTAGGEIVERGVDRGLLVVGLLVGKARGELVGGAGLHRQLRRFAKLPLGRDLDQFVGDLADAVLQPRLAGLPAGAAEPVELDAGVLGAVARQQLDVLDRQVELGALGVVDFQAVVRRAGRLDVLQADEAADAVIDMHDQIAGGEARHLGDEVVGALGRPPRPHQPVAQNVLLADERRRRRSRSRLRGPAPRAPPAASAAPAPPARTRPA